MLRLTLLAHAPTPAQREGRFAADDDAIVPVSSATVERLVKLIGRCDAVARGPERRAAETAGALGLAAVPTEDLRAWAAGAWAGRSIEEIADREPAAFAAWHVDPETTPPGGESLLELLARVSGWLDSPDRADGRVLVIADQAPIRAIVLHVLAAPPPTFWRFDVAPLALSIAQRAQGQWRLRSLDNPQ